MLLQQLLNLALSIYRGCSTYEGIPFLLRDITQIFAINRNSQTVPNMAYKRQM